MTLSDISEDLAASIFRIQVVYGFNLSCIVFHVGNGVLKKPEFNRGRRTEGANGGFCGDAPATEAALEHDKSFSWMTLY
jgi:hypothetical protein